MVHLKLPARIQASEKNLDFILSERDIPQSLILETRKLRSREMTCRKSHSEFKVGWT